jgi:hypothetical protein
MICEGKGWHKEAFNFIVSFEIRELNKLKYWLIIKWNSVTDPCEG